MTGASFVDVSVVGGLFVPSLPCGAANTNRANFVFIWHWQQRPLDSALPSLMGSLAAPSRYVAPRVNIVDFAALALAYFNPGSPYTKYSMVPALQFDRMSPWNVYQIMPRHPEVSMNSSERDLL